MRKKAEPADNVRDLHPRLDHHLHGWNVQTDPRWQNNFRNRDRLGVGTGDRLQRRSGVAEVASYYGHVDQRVHSDRRSDRLRFRLRVQGKRERERETYAAPEINAYEMVIFRF